MKTLIRYIVFLCWFSYLILNSTYLFKEGFLLSRVVQDSNATCKILKEGSTETIVHGANNKICLKSSRKVILLIVDAFRYDFALYNEKNAKPHFYENKLPIIKNTLENHPDSTRLFKFIADPPTTTMQRLKALTTGSLPTFIDAGSNFASSEIKEDNIIDQLVKNHHNVVFMGDDTWTLLYPNRFLRNYPFPSFDVWDLDTVDNGVRENLIPEMKNTDWKLLIGHLLGVDHCGHKFGPNHVEMARKLEEVNNFTRDVIEAMDEDTILFVIGDHGMTVTGDHGGETDDEITAAMFVHSKKPLFNSATSKTSVKQVDFVPTLSTILGVPIPFQNLGILILNALPNLNNEHFPMLSLWTNALQVMHYIKTYSKNSEELSDDLTMKTYYREFEKLILRVEDSKFQFDTILVKTIEAFIGQMRKLCEQAWIQFDYSTIWSALFLLSLTLSLMFVIFDGVPLRGIAILIDESAILGGLKSVFSIALLWFFMNSAKVTKESFSIFNVSASVVFNTMNFMPIVENWALIRATWYERLRNFGKLDFICKTVLIFNLISVFSNSFVIEEASLLLFLISTLILATLWTIFSFYANFSEEMIPVYLKLISPTLVVSILLKYSTKFWRCRPEQAWCLKLAEHLKNDFSNCECIISAISLIIFWILLRKWLKKCGNLNIDANFVTSPKLIPLVLISMIVCWIFQDFDDQKSIKVSTYTALFVYIMFVYFLIEFFLYPVCITIINTTSNSGWGSSFSAFFIILAFLFILPITLLLGSEFGSSLVIMMLTGALFLYLTSILRLLIANNFLDLFDVPNIALIGWFLLPQYFFYATGHQPIFSNIHWKSAFIGTRGISTNIYVQALLVLINTFGVYFLAGILLPLLAISPFTVLNIYPYFAKGKDFFAMQSKGELILHENNGYSVSTMFTCCCKYLILASLKVFFSMLAATIHCRHLMVWSIFAPKFIFEALSLFATVIGVILGFILFAFLHYKFNKYRNFLILNNLII